MGIAERGTIGRRRKKMKGMRKMGVYLGDPYTLPDTDAKWRRTVGFRSDSGIHAAVATLTNVILHPLTH